MAHKKIVARFYQAGDGTCPVREWLRKLPVVDKHAIGGDLARVEFGWPIGMPVCKSIGDGLWEVRSRLPSERTARLIFYIADGEAFVLHGFIKKTTKTPKADLALARKRKKELEQ
ncbi:MAG: type II toxin-antitoxin system RelE/ParE family toxin [Burkholderiales bacterium]